MGIWIFLCNDFVYIHRHNVLEKDAIPNFRMVKCFNNYNMFKYICNDFDSEMEFEYKRDA